MGKMKEGGKLPFPVLLYRILEDVSAATRNMVADPIISWENNGKGFKIHQPEVFNENILPLYSRSNRNKSNNGGNNKGGTNTTTSVVVNKKKTLYRSFQRQLNIYGFRMDKKTSTYYHSLFHHGCDILTLSTKIRPIPVKMTCKKMTSKKKNTNTNVTNTNTTNTTKRSNKSNSKAPCPSSSSSHEVEKQQQRTIPSLVLTQ